MTIGIRPSAIDRYPSVAIWLNTSRTRASFTSLSMPKVGIRSGFSHARSCAREPRRILTILPEPTRCPASCTQRLIACATRVTSMVSNVLSQFEQAPHLPDCEESAAMSSPAAEPAFGDNS